MTTTDDNDNNEDVAMKEEEEIREPEINDPEDSDDDNEHKDVAMKEEDSRDETENKAVDNENEGEDSDDKEEAPKREDPDKSTVKEEADDDDEASKNKEDPEKPTVEEEADDDDDDEASKKEDPYKLPGNDNEDGDEDESPTKDDDSSDDDDDDFDTNESSKKKSSKKKRKAAGRGNKKDKVDDSSSEPKAKKLRVKPEKVKEVSEKIIEELAKSYGWAMKEMPMDTLASNVGYKNSRSDAILEAMKLLIKEGVVKKVKNVCMFTEDGIEKYAPAEEEIKAGNPEEALNQMWNQLENKLKSGKKTKGEKVLGNAKKIWELLQDGNPHSMDEVFGVTNYKMDRSTGFPETLNALTKALKFATKADKQLQLTEKVLKFVHPTTETNEED